MLIAGPIALALRSAYHLAHGRSACLLPDTCGILF